MEIFDKFIVVDEKAISELTVSQNCDDCNWSFRDVTQFAALPVHSTEAVHLVTSSVPMTMLFFISFIIRNLKKREEKSDENAFPAKINDTHTLNKGSEIYYNSSANASSFIIRILKKPEKKSDENPFPAPSNSSPDDDLIVKIGDKQMAVSAHWLSSVSPVISRMLSVEMKEKQQRMLTLDELGVDMDQFMEFLEAITYLNGSFLPNPKNVLVLLKLADYFQVNSLKSRCETHLINCVEIPLIDRFLLIDRYGLDNLKNYFLNLDVIKLRAFFNANHKQFLPVISKEFLCALSVRALAGL